jgi:hypothetical protein
MLAWLLLLHTNALSLPNNVLSSRLLLCSRHHRRSHHGSSLVLLLCARAPTAGPLGSHWKGSSGESWDLPASSERATSFPSSACWVLAMESSNSQRRSLAQELEVWCQREQAPRSPSQKFRKDPCHVGSLSCTVPLVVGDTNMYSAFTGSVPQRAALYKARAI